MNDLQVGDWTVIDDQIMEVTGFTPDGTVIVRPLASSPVTLDAGWAADGVPVPPVPSGPPILLHPVGHHSRAERVEQIRAAMRLARANPGREIIFDVGVGEAEDPDAAAG